MERGSWQGFVVVRVFFSIAYSHMVRLEPEIAGKQAHSFFMELVQNHP